MFPMATTYKYPNDETGKTYYRGMLYEFDGTNAKMLVDIFKATFIYIYVNSVYKMSGISKYVIKRSEIQYSEIIKILNSEYGYDIDENEGNNKKSEITTFIRKHLNYVELLINFKTIKFHTLDSDTMIELKGRDIYWNDWKDYIQKHNL